MSLRNSESRARARAMMLKPKEADPPFKLPPLPPAPMGAPPSSSLALAKAPPSSGLAGPSKAIASSSTGTPSLGPSFQSASRAVGLSQQSGTTSSPVIGFATELSRGGTLTIHDSQPEVVVGLRSDRPSKKRRKDHWGDKKGKSQKAHSGQTPNLVDEQDQQLVETPFAIEVAPPVVEVESPKSVEVPTTGVEATPFVAEADNLNRPSVEAPEPWD